jgi:hypothetical protein
VLIAVSRLVALLAKELISRYNEEVDITQLSIIVTILTYILIVLGLYNIVPDKTLAAIISFILLGLIILSQETEAEKLIIPQKDTVTAERILQ